MAEKRFSIGVSTDVTMQELQDEWALGVGRFLMAFAAIESYVHWLIKLLASERVLRALGHVPIPTRIELVQALAKDRNIPMSTRDALQDALKEFKRLSGPRNLAAHNGLVFEMAIDDAGSMVVQPIIASVASGKTIGLDELRDATVELKTLASTFMELHRQCAAELLG